MIIETAPAVFVALVTAVTIVHVRKLARIIGAGIRATL